MDLVSHLTYPEVRVNDHTLDPNLPSPSHASTSKPFSQTIAHLGALDRLPPELIEQILLHLDIRSLVNFQYTNRRSAESVNRFPLYKAVATHARNILRGILSIQNGKWITCVTLFEELCTSECKACGDFGGYLFLLTCRRVCFLCFTKDKTYLPLGLNHACRQFGLDRAVVGNLPCMRAIPGVYSLSEEGIPETTLVDYKSAFDAAIARHGSMEDMHQFVLDQEAEEFGDHEKKKVQALRPDGSRHMPKPRIADPLDRWSGHPFRFVAIVRAPWLSKSSPTTAEWGFHCWACARSGAISSRSPFYKRQIFTAASFQEHIEWCGPIENGVHC